jgi:hypothetical protein
MATELIGTGIETVNGNRILTISVATKRGEVCQHYWLELIGRAGACVPHTALLTRFGEDDVIYTVNLASGKCDCPDATYRPTQEGCKHSKSIRALFSNIGGQ